MNSREVGELLERVSRYYPAFRSPDPKATVKDWLAVLGKIPLELAIANLVRYAGNPENKYAPHPGALSEGAVQRSESNYVPDAEETRRMLEEQQSQLSADVTDIPASARERMRQLGYISKLRSD